MSHQHRNDSRKMDNIGVTIGEKNKNLAAQRNKRGECPTCGTKTHQKKGILGKKIPLTIAGKVLNGLCLRCHPEALEGYKQRRVEPPGQTTPPRIPQPRYEPPRPIPSHSPDMPLPVPPENRIPATPRSVPPNFSSIDVPMEIVPNFDDEASEVTMDIELKEGFQRMTMRQQLDTLPEDEFSDDREIPPPVLRRPEPSVCPENDRPDSRPPRVGPYSRNSARPPSSRQRIPSRSIPEHDINLEGGIHGVHETFHHSAPADLDYEHSQLNPQLSPTPRRYSSGTRGRVSMERRDNWPSSHQPFNPSHPSSPLRDAYPEPWSSSPHHRPMRLMKNEEVPLYLNLSSQQQQQQYSQREIPVMGDPRIHSVDEREFALHPLQEQAEFRYSKQDAPVSGRASTFGHDLPRLPSRGDNDDDDVSDISEERHLHEERNLHIPDSTGDLQFTPTGYILKHEHELKPAAQDSAKWSEPTLLRDEDDEPPPPILSRRPGPDEDATLGPPVMNLRRQASPAKPRPPSPQPARPRPPSPPVATSRARSPSPVRPALDSRYTSQMANRTVGKGPTLRENLETADIPKIIDSLREDNKGDSRLREMALRSLTEIIWKSGQKAKVLIRDRYGIEILVKLMWDDISNVNTQTESTELLFALAASTDGESESDVLVGENADSAVDALLIAMQNNISVENIQRSGCGALYCLASATNSNPSVNDGSLSQATLCVANAMDVHRRSKSVQDMGLRALYSQCMLSINAESNKSSLSGFESGGINVISHAMQVLQSDIDAATRACRLFWCLSSSEPFAEQLGAVPSHLLLIMETLRQHMGKHEADSLIEAAYGAIANVSKHEKSHDNCLQAGVIDTVLDSMPHYDDVEGLLLEACSVMANLASTQKTKEHIIENHGIQMLSSSINAFPENHVLVEEALRALVSLASGKARVKLNLSHDEVLSSLIEVVVHHDDSKSLQEMAFSLFCTLSAELKCASSLVTSGVIPLTLKAMKIHKSERKLQEHICMLWRNLACHREGSRDLLSHDAIAALIHVMSAHEKSEVVQVNACCALWHLSTELGVEDHKKVFGDDVVVGIVQAMQSHLESAPVVEMACGALWSLVNKSVGVHGSIASSGGIDAVTCALVMHPEDTRTLEMACGVLSNVTATATIAQALNDAQAVSLVVETMRSNSSAINVLEFGSLILRNVVLIDPDCGSEVSGGISTMINAMKNNPDAAGFLREACNALCAMAARSSECRSKILALDGISVLMNTLERSNVLEVQDAARGAFNQLATISSSNSS